MIKETAPFLEDAWCKSQIPRMQSWLKWDSLGSPNSPRNVISINLSPHPGGKNRTPKRGTSMRPKSPISIHRHQVYCSVPGVDSQTPKSFAACGEVTSFGKKRTNILKGMQASKCSHQYIILCVFFKFLGRKKTKKLPAIWSWLWQKW